MKLKDLVNKSTYCTVGFIEDLDTFKTLEGYIAYNLLVLKEFKQHIIVTNYREFTPELVTQNSNFWKAIFPECILIDLEINRGHSFGIAVQENAIVEYCKKNNIDWICKASHDVLFNQSILEKDLPQKDFYYLNGIGYGGMAKYGFDLEKIKNEDFYPQTNFYFINTDKIDYLYDRDYVNEIYDYIQGLESYNGKIWEYIEGWTCEDFLKSCVIRNNLSKYHLVPQKTYIKLLEHIKQSQIHDCSHKNIMIEGICHFQYPEQQILVI